MKRTQAKEILSGFLFQTDILLDNRDQLTAGLNLLDDLFWYAKSCQSGCVLPFPAIDGGFGPAAGSRPYSIRFDSSGSSPLFVINCLQPCPDIKANAAGRLSEKAVAIDQQLKLQAEKLRGGPAHLHADQEDLEIIHHSTDFRVDGQVEDGGLLFRVYLQC